MTKWLKVSFSVMLAAAVFGTVGLLRQRRTLDEGIIRLHVVANSNDIRDQRLKLEVKDAVLSSVSDALEGITDVHQAENCIRRNLTRIQKTAREILDARGCGDAVTVTLKETYFDTKHYDTFSLPAGVYNALCVTIGQGQGENWWCVVYPSFCVRTVEDDFSQLAVQTGFSESLTETLEREKGYEIRFFFLELLGKLEGFRRGE